MARRLGMFAKLYRSATLATDNTAASYDAKTWIEVGNVRDVTLSLETGQANVTTRENEGWTQTLATLKDGTIEFEMVWDTTDTNFAAFKNAWLNGTEIAIAAMTGDILVAGEEGLAGNFSVVDFSMEQPLEGAVTASVTLRPSSENNWWTTES